MGQSTTASQRRVRPRQGSGFHLTSGSSDNPTEEQQRLKESNDVKVDVLSSFACSIVFIVLTCI